MLRMILAAVLVFSWACSDEGGLTQRSAELVVTPNPLVFDRAPTHVAVSERLRLENPGDFNLVVESVSIEEGASFTVLGETAETAFEVPPGGVRELDIGFMRIEPTDASGTLVIRSTATGKEETRIALQAPRRNGPLLFVCVESADIPLLPSCHVPAALDFGRVRLGEEHGALITLRSEGTEPVMVSELSYAGSGSIRVEAPTLLPLTIAAGDVVEMPLHFRPAAEEPSEGNLSIQWNGMDEAVAVRGEGVALGLCLDPAELDFGTVAIGDHVDRALRLSSCGNEPVEITGAEIQLGASVFSLIDTIERPMTLAPQTSFEMRVRFAPSFDRREVGRLRITTPSGSALVPLFGAPPSCLLRADPPALSFEALDRYNELARVTELENQGALPCTIEGIEIPTASTGFRASHVEPPIVLQPGESTNVSVLFNPQVQEELIVSARLEIRVPEQAEALIVPLSAMIKTCDLTIAPESLLSFGNVAGPRTLGVRLVDHSGSACPIDAIRLLDDGGGAFILPAERIDPVDLFGDVFVELAPAMSGTFEGSLEIAAEPPNQQRFMVRLSGSSGAPGICVEPRDLAFGAAGSDDVTITACGSDPLTIAGLDWATADAELSLANAPALPFTLAAGESRSITVQYDPQDTTGDTALLAVRSSDVLSPEIMVRATGGPAIVPASAGRQLYFGRLGESVSGTFRLPLQGDSRASSVFAQNTSELFVTGHRVTPDGRYVVLGTWDLGGAMLIYEVETNSIGSAPHPEGQTGVLFTARPYLSFNPDVNTNPPYQYVIGFDGDLMIGSLYTRDLAPLAGASDPSFFETMPSWGPDGRIAFVRYDPTRYVDAFTFNGASDICLVDEAGGATTLLSGAAGNSFTNYLPQFSPNGQWLAFSVSELAIDAIGATDAQVRLVRTDGSGQVLPLPLLNGGASLDARWSFDGAFLAFTSDRAGPGSADVFIAPIDPISGQEGAAFEPSTVNSIDTEYSPEWSR